MLQRSLIISCLAFFTINTFGQSNTVSTGGDASGSGGSASYTIGQIDYNNQTGTGGNLNQGVQQPFEIYEVNGISEQLLTISLKIGPNPTTDILMLSSEFSPQDNLSFLLYDGNGKEILSRSNLSSYEEISVAKFPVGIYQLVVSNLGTEIKSFKIIKI